MPFLTDYLDGRKTLNITHHELTRLCPTTVPAEYLKVGETFYFHGEKFIVNQISFSTSTAEDIEVTYACESCDVPVFAYEFYDWTPDHAKFTTKEDISEETRKEFMELLK